MATCLWIFVVTLWVKVGEVLAMNALQEKEVSCVTFWFVVIGSMKVPLFEVLQQS